MTSDGKHITLKNPLIVDIKNRIKHMNLNNRRDFLRMCLRNHISTPEIASLAKRTISETGNCPRQHREERRILRNRIFEKDREIADSQRKMRYHMREIHKNLGLSDHAMREYYVLRKIELNSKWDIHKDRIKGKKNFVSLMSDQGGNVLSSYSTIQ